MNRFLFKFVRPNLNIYVCFSLHIPRTYRLFLKKKKKERKYFSHRKNLNDIQEPFPVYKSLHEHFGPTCIIVSLVVSNLKLFE